MDFLRLGMNPVLVDGGVRTIQTEKDICDNHPHQLEGEGNTFSRRTLLITVGVNGKMRTRRGKHCTDLFLIPLC